MLNIQYWLTNDNTVWVLVGLFALIAVACLFAYFIEAIHVVNDTTKTVAIAELLGLPRSGLTDPQEQFKRNNARSMHKQGDACDAVAYQNTAIEKILGTNPQLNEHSCVDDLCKEATDPRVKAFYNARHLAAEMYDCMTEALEHHAKGQLAGACNAVFKFKEAAARAAKFFHLYGVEVGSEEHKNFVLDKLADKLNSPSDLSVHVSTTSPDGVRLKSSKEVVGFADGDKYTATDLAGNKFFVHSWAPWWHPANIWLFISSVATSCVNGYKWAADYIDTVLMQRKRIDWLEKEVKRLTFARSQLVDLIAELQVEKKEQRERASKYATRAVQNATKAGAFEASLRKTQLLLAKADEELCEEAILRDKFQCKVLRLEKKLQKLQKPKAKKRRCK